MYRCCSQSNPCSKWKSDSSGLTLLTRFSHKPCVEHLAKTCKVLIGPLLHQTQHAVSSPVCVLVDLICVCAADFLLTTRRRLSQCSPRCVTHMKCSDVNTGLVADTLVVDLQHIFKF